MSEESVSSHDEKTDRGAVIETNKEYSRSIRTRKNSLSEKDYEYSTEMNRYFLKLIGIWPAGPEAGICEKGFIKFRICCCYFLMSYLLVPCVLLKFLAEKNSALKLKMIGPLSFISMAMLKFTFLVLHRQNIYDCLEHIAGDWANVKSSRERKIMLNDAKFGRFLASLCAGFMYGGGFFYHTILPLTIVIVTPDNVTLRPLTHPVYDPFFDSQASPIYEIVFITHWCSACILYTVTIAACSIAAVFAIHACGQFKIIVSRLNNLIDGESEQARDSVDERLADIVELHLRTLNFVTNLEGVLNQVCLVELVGCTMNLCFLGYYFMAGWENRETMGTITYCVLFVSFAFNIFMFCYIGEKLTEQSKRVGTMTYMIDWYRLQYTEARGLILILVISKYPARMTAGKMSELSMTCFLNVLKTAFTYLNLLRTIAN